MIRYARLLSAALLAAATFGCGPPFTPPPYQPTTAALGRPPGATILSNKPDCTDRNTFANSVKLLDSSFRFNQPGAGYQSPSSNVAISSQQIADLAAAYDNLPDLLKNPLCSLDGIFVQTQTDGLGSWGFRERAADQGGTGSYIGLSSALWTGTNQAIPYHVFETMVLNSLLNVTGPAYTYASYDGSDMTILAVLAHEMGHILWWQKGIFSKPCATPPAGLPQYFSQISWKNAVPTPRFHDFGKQDNGFGGSGGNRRYAEPGKDEIQKDLNSKKYTEGITGLGQVYYLVSYSDPTYNGQWAGLFATVTPDEDFIETYKLMVIASAKKNALTSLQINIPFLANPTIDIFSIANSSTLLQQKVSWIQTCLPQL